MSDFILHFLFTSYGSEMEKTVWKIKLTVASDIQNIYIQTF